jgi:hypothetical protein
MDKIDILIEFDVVLIVTITQTIYRNSDYYTIESIPAIQWNISKYTHQTKYTKCIQPPTYISSDIIAEM